MKYLYLKNIIEIKNRIFKYYLLQLILLVSYIIINSNVIKYFDLVKYSSILGLENIKGAYFLDILIKITSYLVIIHLIFKVFTENILKTIQYIMIRLNSKKWIFYEIFNYSIYVVIMRVIYNVLLYFSFNLFGSHIIISSFIIVMLKDILFYINILLLILLALNLFSYNGFLKILFIIPIILIISTFFIPVIELPFVFLLMSIVKLLIINIYIFSPSRFYTEYCNK